MTMQRFVGFEVGPRADGSQRLTGVPASFFTDLLPQITNMNELKVTLHFLYLAGRKRGEPKWVGYWELEAAQDLLQGLRRGGDPRPPQQHLHEGLELAIARGTLLRVLASPAPDKYFKQAKPQSELEPVDTTFTTWFLLNTEANREFVRQVETGELSLEHTTLVQGLDIWDWPLPLPVSQTEVDPHSPISQTIDNWQEQRWQVQSKRRDIYTLFEQNIATLTPLISEQLREAAQIYPPEWIEDAFSEAVSYNRRSWRYILRILENWAETGRSEQQRGQKQYGRNRQTEGSEYSQSERDTRNSGGERSREAEAGRRPTVGADGARTTGADGQLPATSEPPARRPAPPNQPAGPIDFTKYTTGKYAHLFQSDEPFNPPKPKQ